MPSPFRQSARALWVDYKTDTLHFPFFKSSLIDEISATFFQLIDAGLLPFFRFFQFNDRLLNSKYRYFSKLRSGAWD
jgi:hypothetical protein